LTTTKIYSHFLFDKIPIFDSWIEDANKFDLFLFLDNDAPYIQDGTRLKESERNKLRDYYLEFFRTSPNTLLGVNVKIINGVNWEERTEKSIEIIKAIFNI
jgi:HTH-type transcriptional repressor of NAD biosynthesis genes